MYECGASHSKMVARVSFAPSAHSHIVTKHVGCPFHRWCRACQQHTFRQLKEHLDSDQACQAKLCGCSKWLRGWSYALPGAEVTCQLCFEGRLALQQETHLMLWLRRYPAVCSPQLLVLPTGQARAKVCHACHLTFAAAMMPSSSSWRSGAPPLTRSSTEKMSQMPVSSWQMPPCTRQPPLLPRTE